MWSYHSSTHQVRYIPLVKCDRVQILSEEIERIATSDPIHASSVYPDVEVRPSPSEIATIIIKDIEKSGCAVARRCGGDPEEAFVIHREVGERRPILWDGRSGTMG